MPFSRGTRRRYVPTTKVSFSSPGNRASVPVTPSNRAQKACLLGLGLDGISPAPLSPTGESTHAPVCSDDVCDMGVSDGNESDELDDLSLADIVGDVVAPDPPPSPLFVLL